MRKLTTLLLTITSLGMLAAPALATDSYKDLSLFKSGTFSRGLWRVEMLSSSDQRMMQSGGMMNKMGICMNATDGLEKHAGHADSEEKCTLNILRNTSDVAEVTRSCPNGSSTHTTITRESSKSFLIDNQMTSDKGKQHQMKMRYSYEGACKSTDPAIQMDKNSEACKKMGNMDMTKMAGMCAKLPPDAKAQCEQRMQSMAGMCQ